MTTKKPARRPVAAWPAILVSLALIAIAVIGVRELFVALDWVTGERWTDNVLDFVDGRGQDFRIIAVGVGLVIVGLVMLYAVVRPASRTHLLTDSTDPEIWISRKAVSSIAKQAVERVPGVHRVDASTGRKLTVRASVTDPGAADRINEALNGSVGKFLTQPPRVSIRKATP